MPKKLLGELLLGRNQDVQIIAKICLSTGSRWSEAETLRAERVKDGLIHFVGTKNSKTRSVPIDQDLEQ